MATTAIIDPIEDYLRDNPKAKIFIGGVSVSRKILPFLAIGTSILTTPPSTGKAGCSVTWYKREVGGNPFWDRRRQVAVEETRHPNDNGTPFRAIDVSSTKDQTDESCKIAVQQNGYALEFIENQTEELCKLAVQQNGLALTLVKDQTDEVCKLAVQQNGMALRYVKNQTGEICKLAVQQNGNALFYVNNQTEELCYQAILQNSASLANVNNQTLALCMLALYDDSHNSRYIRSRVKKVICSLIVGLLRLNKE